MDLDAWKQARKDAQRSRHAPGRTSVFVVEFGGKGELPAETPPGLIELTIQATNEEFDIAQWFDADWWTDVIQRWADHPVTVHIAPTPGALLHPVVLLHLESLRRVVPGWRLVGHAMPEDLESQDAVAQLAVTGYHEVRFHGQPSSDTACTDRGASRQTAEQVMARLREELNRLGAKTPILVRLPAGSAEITDDSVAHSAEPSRDTEPKTDRASLAAVDHTEKVG